MHPLLTAAVVRGYVTAEQAREHADAQSAAELITRGLLTPEIARELEDAMNTLRRAGEDLRAAFDEGAGGVPPRIGRYTIVGELGRGGMGVVYRAEDTELRRTVAIKAIRDNAEPEERARFLREARAAAALRHPGIVPVHDVGEEGGRPYFIMEFVDGMSLLQAIERKTLTLRERVDAVRQAAVAVAAAHQRGILHRDLKPANILVTPEKQALVTDFGLARVEREPDRALSVSGVALGTPAYMSPEQARGRWSEVDARTDVYGLGATLYHALTGGPPFSAASIAEILAHVLEREPMAPRLLEPTVDRDLEAVCLKALEKDPARRYLSAQEFADDLDRWLAGKPLGGVPRPPRRWWIAFPAAALVAAAAAVALYPRRTATVPQQAESAGTTKSPSVEESAAKAVPPEVAATASARSLLRLAVPGVYGWDADLSGEHPRIVALRHASRGEFDEADRALLGAGDPDPYVRGVIAVERLIHGSDAAAFDRWSGELPADPAPPLRTLRAVGLAVAGRHDEARAEADRLPGGPEPAVARMIVAARAGRFDDAAAHEAEAGAWPCVFFLRIFAGRRLADDELRASLPRLEAMPGPEAALLRAVFHALLAEWPKAETALDRERGDFSRLRGSDALRDFALRARESRDQLQRFAALLQWTAGDESRAVRTAQSLTGSNPDRETGADMHFLLAIHWNRRRDERRFFTHLEGAMKNGVPAARAEREFPEWKDDPRFRALVGP